MPPFSCFTSERREPWIIQVYCTAPIEKNHHRIVPRYRPLNLQKLVVCSRCFINSTVCTTRFSGAEGSIEERN